MGQHTDSLIIIVETSTLTGLATRWAMCRFWRMSSTNGIALGVASFWGMIGFLTGVLL